MIKQIKTGTTKCLIFAVTLGATVDAVPGGEKSTGTLAHGGSLPMRKKLCCLH